MLNNSSQSYNHFDLFEWTIYLPEFTKDQVENEVYAQSVLIHEYIHYCQQLSSTFGRIFLKNIITSLLRASIFIRYGPNVPSQIDNLNIRDLITNASPYILINSDIKKDHEDLMEEYEIITAGEPFPVTSHDPELFVYDKVFSKSRNTSHVYPHILAEFLGSKYYVPLSERVIYENMARQIQRNYLQFNNQRQENLIYRPDTEIIDSLRNNTGEVIYVCVHDEIKKILPDTEDISAWTIAICQISLLCRLPGDALKHLFDMLRSLNPKKMEVFLQSCTTDVFFNDNYNVPNMQEYLNDIMLEHSKYLVPQERILIHDFIKRVVAISNAVNSNKLYFYNAQMNQKDFFAFMNSFGCPPIICSDGELKSIFGYDIQNPLREYFVKIYKLLS
ncbi:MAG: hypothetical protein HUU54_14240 [Ignavibacteriaceae bacterium]|nr:hypothetical protein [Ignavibacteriaceae bacterium]